MISLQSISGDGIVEKELDPHRFHAQLQRGDDVGIHEVKIPDRFSTNFTCTPRAANMQAYSQAR